MVRLVSWNVAHRDLLEHLTALDADVALLQEAPPSTAASQHEVLPAIAPAWRTGGGPRRIWRTAIVRLSDRVTIRPHTLGTLDAGRSTDELCLSLDGSITAADVLVDGAVVFTAISVYAAWEYYPDRRGYADAAAHRILSDISALTPERGHRLVVAGDWNLLRGYGEMGSSFWRDRYATVFTRAETLGLRFVGPTSERGRQADPWPDELPRDSTCVPTFHHSQATPSTATRQLDFVFASDSIAAHVTTSAMNEPAEWGPSDHCRVIVEVNLP